MKIPLIGAHISAAAATVLLVLLYWTSIHSPWSLVILLPGILWFLAQRWKITFVDPIMLVLYTFASAAAILPGGEPLLALPVILASLAAWQLVSISRRLVFAQDASMQHDLLVRHLRRLGFVIGTQPAGSRHRPDHAH